MKMLPDKTNGKRKDGIIKALSSNMIWGLLPLYISFVSDLSAWGVTGVRVISCFAVLVCLVIYQRRLKEIKIIFKSGKEIKLLLISSSLLIINWLTYAYAVSTGNVLEGSLGYFIYPLFVVGLGWLFFKERFNSLEKLAIGVAILAVGYAVMFYGKLPWIGLVLATSFSFYGVVRKKSSVEPILTLAIETLFIMPIAIGVVMWQFYFLNEAPELLLLAKASFLGPITVLAMWLYISAVRVIPYSLSGMLFYISPSLQIGVALYLGEILSINKLIAFILVWISLAIYSFGNIKRSKPMPNLK
ncbi:MAG: EamA family transporter RarD [SAR324 cluster bacterium]|nr:EamA family transporter RarD [SAR324 cluster bacterium]